MSFLKRNTEKKQSENYESLPAHMSTLTPRHPTIASYAQAMASRNTKPEHLDHYVEVKPFEAHNKGSHFASAEFKAGARDPYIYQQIPILLELVIKWENDNTNMENLNEIFKYTAASGINIHNFNLHESQWEYVLNTPVYYQSLGVVSMLGEEESASVNKSAILLGKKLVKMAEFYKEAAIKEAKDNGDTFQLSEFKAAYDGIRATSEYFTIVHNRLELKNTITHILANPA